MRKKNIKKTYNNEKNLIRKIRHMRHKIVRNVGCWNEAMMIIKTLFPFIDIVTDIIYKKL